MEHKLSAMFLSAFFGKSRCEYRDRVTVFTFVLERCGTVMKNGFDKTPEKNSNNKRDENATVKKIMVFDVEKL